MIITKDLIENFKNHLIEEEKSQATFEKYIRDVTAFYVWLAGREVEIISVLRYKEYLSEKYASACVNSV